MHLDNLVTIDDVPKFQLDDIILTKIDFNEYIRVQQIYGVNVKDIFDDSIYYSLKNPLAEQDIVEATRKLRETGYLDAIEISPLNKKGRKITLYMRHMDQLIDVVRSMENEYGVNGLIFCAKVADPSVQQNDIPFRDRACITFIRNNHLYVSYKLLIPNQQLELFGLPYTSNTTEHRAIWNPLFS